VPVAQPAAPTQSPAEALAIKDATDAVDKSKKRLKCTSYTLMVLGAIGVIVSFVHGFGARGIAEKIVNKGKKPEEISQFITRDEFTLYDTFINLSFLSFLMSILVLGIGKCGKKAIWWKRSMVIRRNRRKSGFMVLVLIILCFVASSIMDDIKPIMSKYKAANKMHGHKHGHHHGDD
jgi:uncharacterized BrkB/YihY/UPF0761 family membrane protein